MWYEESVSKARGWLCPALFRYFATAPDSLYVRVERLIMIQSLVAILIASRVMRIDVRR